MFYIICVLVALLGIAFFKLKRGKTSVSRNKTFIIGDTNSGKTSLLYMLANGNNSIQTTNSIEPNETTLGEKHQNCNIVDIPGHSYAREQFIKRMNEAKQIILLVDASNIQTLPTVADFFYNIITNTVYQQYKIPILISLNKTELPNSFKIVDFEIFFTKEIEKIKTSRRAIQDQREGFNDTLRYDESQFSFDKYRQIKLCEVSVKKQDLSQVENFLIK